MVGFASDANAPSGLLRAISGTRPMNKNTTEGQLKQVKGSVKEALGKVIGNDSLEAEGATEKAVGKAQKGAGEAHDIARETTRKKPR